MTRSSSVSKGPSKAEEYESQDSQAVLDALRAHLGVGTWNRKLQGTARADGDTKGKLVTGHAVMAPGSQETPTQVNADRDYGDFFLVDTLQADDTGAVNFGELSPVLRTSQVSQDAGFENTRGGWRQTNQGLETPAPSKNPFAATADIPLSGSQLFGQTQPPAKVSPTSSRPSPCVYESTSPMSMLQKRVDSSPVKAVQRQPLAHYTPMKHSQERKAGEPGGKQVGDDDDDDDDDDESEEDAAAMMERRRRIGRMKAQAAREMEKVRIVRTESGLGRKRRKMCGVGSRGAKGGDVVPPETAGEEDRVPATSPMRSSEQPRKGLDETMQGDRRRLRQNGKPEASEASRISSGDVDAGIAGQMAPLSTAASQSSRPTTPCHAHPTAPVSPSSSVTTLTPAPSSEAASPESDGQTSISLPSPTVGKRGRSGPPPRAPLKREAHADTGSTDELQWSSSTLTTTGSRGGRAAQVRGRKLFAGMAFAISMASERERRRLEREITQAGGAVLPSGFQEMFEATEKDFGETSLTPAGLGFGFTALVADGHSRKVKYMQALVLGLPCLAYQWVAACMGKGSVVDWQAYLLAAGSSAVLGDAVRSRSLRGYAAEGARLEQTLAQRARLLAGQKLLMVVDGKRARRREKREYVFLAVALGGDVCRVSTVKEAREALGREGFDWIYVDEAVGTAGSILAVPGKRRRGAAAAGGGKVRVLSDEVVIQSLILGRMLGEDEVD